MTVFAYCRVSTKDAGQSTENQKILLESSNIRIDRWCFEEGVSGTVDPSKRPVFSAMLAEMKENDCLVVSALDRVSRSSLDALTMVELLKKRKIKFIITSFGALDITSPHGELLVAVMAALAAMEVALIKDRVRAGLVRTKASGTILGAANKNTPQQVASLVAMKAQGMTLDAITASTGVPRNTVARLVRANRTEGAMEAYSKRYDTCKVQHVVNKEKRANNGRTS